MNTKQLRYTMPHIGLVMSRNMLGRRLIILICLISPFITYAQSDSTEFYYYANGKIRWEITQRDTYEVHKEFYKKGTLKDSFNVKNGLYYGTRKLYYKNKSLKKSIDYGSNPLEEPILVKIYRKDSSLKITGRSLKGKAFGFHHEYNKKGQAIKFDDMNKDKMVKIPKVYKKPDHLIAAGYDEQITTTKAWLSNEKERVKIKKGAIISIELINDDQIYHHNAIEGFSKDSIYLSKFDYSFSDDKEPLKYDSTYALHFNQLRSIHFSVNNRKLTDLAELITLEFGIIPPLEFLIVLPLIFWDVSFITQPTIIVLIAASPFFYLWSRHISKRTVPREYKMSDWAFAFQK